MSKPAPTVTIEGNELVIRCAIDPHPSNSGKTTVIATTSGNIATNVQFQGKTVTLGVNAYVK